MKMRNPTTDNRLSFSAPVTSVPGVMRPDKTALRAISGGLRGIPDRSIAFYGGSFYVLKSSLNLNDAQLINSSSTSDGGSVLAREGAAVPIKETRIQSSRAANGCGIMLIESYLLGLRSQYCNCSARAHGGSVVLKESFLLCAAIVYSMAAMPCKTKEP